MSDGRNIDSSLGTLSGEGSAQRSRGDRADDKSLTRQVYGAVPGIGRAEGLSYYDRPVVRKSPWSRSIPLYYYVGGTAGGCAVLGAAATVAGRDGFPNLIVRTRWIGTLGSVISGALLVYDLGRPSRFLNMLRIFRPSSPMNVGSWVLTGFSGAIGFSALALRGPDVVRTLGDIAGVKAGVIGLVLSGYTGVLVSQTAVPVWQRPYRTLPLLFLASAMSGASSLLNFFDWNRSEQRAIAVFGAIGQLADAGCSYVAEKQIQEVPEAAKPLREGFSGFLWKAGKALTLASLALTLTPGTSRTKRSWIGALGTAGALCLRFGIHYAGQRSADNPLATFDQQRYAARRS